jgi:hypothetical protein
MSRERGEDSAEGGIGWNTTPPDRTKAQHRLDPRVGQDDQNNIQPNTVAGQQHSKYYSSAASRGGSGAGIIMR